MIFANITLLNIINHLCPLSSTISSSTRCCPLANMPCKDYSKCVPQFVCHVPSLTHIFGYIMPKIHYTYISSFPIVFFCPFFTRQIQFLLKVPRTGLHDILFRKAGSQPSHTKTTVEETDTSLTLRKVVMYLFLETKSVSPSSSSPAKVSTSTAFKITKKKVSSASLFYEITRGFNLLE